MKAKGPKTLIVFHTYRLGRRLPHKLESFFSCNTRNSIFKYLYESALHEGSVHLENIKFIKIVFNHDTLVLVLGSRA